MTCHSCEDRATMDTAGLIMNDTSGTWSHERDPEVQTAMEYWLRCIEEWYPERHSKAYFLSPLHFNRVPYEKAVVAGLTTLVKHPPNKSDIKSEVHSDTPVVGSLFVPVKATVEKKKKIQGSDVNDDAAIECIRTCFQALWEDRNEAVMVICGLEFGQYLTQEKEITGVSACDKFPRPKTMDEKSCQRGNFDVLILSRRYGIIVGEVKSVGFDAQKTANISQAIVKRAQKALDQLNKAGKVLQHMLSDIKPAIRVAKTLILPFVTSTQLRDAVHTEPQLEQELCRCLGTGDLSEAISRCLCADQLPSKTELEPLSKHITPSREHSSSTQLSDSSNTDSQLPRTEMPFSSLSVQSPRANQHEETIATKPTKMPQNPSLNQSNTESKLHTIPRKHTKPCGPFPEALASGNPSEIKTSPLSLCCVKETTSQNSPTEGPSMPSKSREETRLPGLARKQSHRPGQPSRLSKLADWWDRITDHSSSLDSHMSETLYDHLLARFCGPATTVEIPTVSAPRKVLRTLGQAVAETGLIMSILTLHQEQVQLINDDCLNCVHLYGPPGTGKTVVIVLKASEWLQQGHDVHVLMTRRYSHAVSFVIERQLQQVIDSLKESKRPKVHRHLYDFHNRVEDVERASTELSCLARDGSGKLYIVADEVLDFFCMTRFIDFLTKLREKVPELCLWCASLENFKASPPWLAEKPLTLPLRTPPCITQEIQRSKEIATFSYILAYTPSRTPDATKGPAVRWLKHEGQSGHSDGGAEDCEGCGKAVADLLKELGVGQSGPDSLQHHDVMILCKHPRGELPSNDTVASSQPVMGIVRALRAHNIPVNVVASDASDDDLRDVALALKNEVTVTDYETVSGLERKVVVVVGRKEDEAKEKDVDASRLLAVSRCTALLVCIEKPPD
ncbi:uncharacterized protein [Littorina saxatilis]|uniref:uncharacterized protein n=1 Tax=Littorina saxatilis TaxID=31220 RepID=UPI0038B47B52